MEKIQCPHCSQHYEVSSDDFGATVACQACGKDFVITQPDTDTQDAPENEQAQATKPCPVCAEQILTTAKKCKHCGEFLDGKMRAAVWTLKLPWKRILKWAFVLILVLSNFVVIASFGVDRWKDDYWSVQIVSAIIVALDFVLLAGWKGYSKRLWGLSGLLGGGVTGILGLIIWAFLPFVNAKSKLPEETRVHKKKKGNIIAMVLIPVAIVLTTIRLCAIEVKAVRDEMRVMKTLALAISGFVEAEYCVGKWWDAGLASTDTWLENDPDVKDYRMAALYRSWGKRQYADAQRYIGKWIDNDYAVLLCYDSKNLGHTGVETAKWFLAAAKHGHPKAQYEIACFYDDEGQNPTEAIRWFKEAAKNGDERAKRRLVKLGVYQ